MRLVSLAALALAFTAPAAAQIGSDSYRFLEAVRKGDAPTAASFIGASGPTVIDTKDRVSGDSALHIVTARRDLGWAMLLLQRGAKIDPRDKQGRTPLVLAAELGWAEGVEYLLRRRAQVDAVNNQGETALIRAIHRRDARIVRMLVEGGANPDKADTLAGMSARDYAKNDRRNASLLRLLDLPATAKPKAAVGP